MASSGKKGKRVKGKTINLNTFLADENDSPQAGYAVATTTKKGMNWADEMENEQLDVSLDFTDKYTLENAYSSDKYILPTMPRAARDPCNDLSTIPSKPPFTAFVANLPYDVDQEDIAKFFKNLRVKGIRLPRDSMDSSRHKGFGYADFEDRDSLIEGLKLNDVPLKGRKVRIHVAESQENDRERDRRDDKSDRTIGDWRARDDLPPKDDRSFSRNGPDRYSDRSDRYSSERDWHSGDKATYQSRGGFDRSSQGANNDRDDRGLSSERGFSSTGDRNYDRNYDRGGGGGGGSSYRDRYDGYDRGYDRRGSGRRDYRDDYRERDRDRDTRDWGHNDRRDDYGRRNTDQRSNYDRESSEKETPRERPRLNIKPRSVPLDAPKEAPKSNPSIFGGAKPVDTAAREREIEERLQHEKESKFPPAREHDSDRSRNYDADKWDKKDDRSEDSYDLDSHRRDENDDGLPERLLIKKSSSAGAAYARNSPRSTTSSHNIGHRPDSERSTSHSEQEDDRSEKSTPLGKPPSPRKEDYKAVPAPPPKENAWQKKTVHDGEKENRFYNTVPRAKRSSSISSNTSSGEKDSSRRPSYDNRPPSGRRNGDEGKRRDDSRGRRSEDYRRDDSATRRKNNNDRGGGRMGSGSNQRGGNQGDKNNRRDNTSSHYSRSSLDQGEKRAPEMPKYEESKTPVYASSNKFFLLNNDDVDRGSESD